MATNTCTIVLFLLFTFCVHISNGDNQKQWVRNQFVLGGGARCIGRGGPKQDYIIMSNKDRMHTFKKYTGYNRLLDKKNKNTNLVFYHSKLLSK